MGSGGFFSLQCTITAQIVGAHRLDKALSVLELVVSAGFFAGPVSGGFLLDAFGGPSAGAKAYRPVMVSFADEICCYLIVVQKLIFSAASSTSWVGLQWLRRFVR